MATKSVLQYKWDDHLVKQENDHDEHHVEEQEEEALSLCDLPVTLINHKDQDKSRKQDMKLGETEEQEEDFDFNSWGTNLFSKEPEMCVADEVFFQGQILPLRHSFSSEPSISKSKDSQMKQHNGCNKQFNRSESMDHVSTSAFGNHSNSSSRSCSLRSQNSSSSSSSTSSTTRVSKPEIRNQFHTIPSPKPQLRQSRSSTRQIVFNFGNQGRKSSSSSTWEFFRLGVSPAPEMLGPQDLQFRNRICISRNSSNSSSSSSNPKSRVKKMSSKNGDGGDKSKRGGLLSGCSCTVDSVVAQFDTVMIKSSSTKIKKESVGTATTHAMKEKVVAVDKLNKEEQNKIKKHSNSSNRKKQQAKKVMSRRRTFEWLKELHAIRHSEDEEALLSNT